ncbi:fibrous sheath CABYR-binding protein-like [Carassius auratus]|uniref:Fibrous sheath CABYR-binding protein-like n=1 Tax=Carassius auratus TaxID=7957 RepID=A0A6P6MBS8_CARAU|nr:fibrous sheath CABYR-binding protein-like [Carassius auratus]
MSLSSFLPSFSESAVQSSSPELSDELTAALAAGRWWAIMEVSSPISEEPEYGDLTSVQWRGTMEAGETLCPKSVVFSDECEKTESLHSSFPAATLKTKELWRKKKTQGAPMPPRSQHGAPVPTNTKKRDHNSSLVFNYESKKAESPRSGFTDAALKTKELWRQKKPQGAPVFAGSEFTNEILKTTKQGRQQQRKWTEMKPQVAPEPAGSPQRPPVTTGSQQRGKLMIPENLRQHLLKAASELESPVSARSPQRAPVPTASPQNTAMHTKSLQREAMPAPEVPKPKIPEPLRQELLQQKPNKIQEKQRLKIPEPLRQELLQQKPNKIQEKQRLKIPEPLRQELLQQKPNKIQEKQRLKIPEPLRQELLQLSTRASSVQGAPAPNKTPERQKLKIPEHLRKEFLQQKPQACPVQGDPMPFKSPQEAPLPDRSPVYVGTPQGAGVFARSPPAEAVPAEPPKVETVPSRTTKTRKRRIAEHQSIPVSATQALPMSSRTSSVVPVHSGTLQGALVTKSSPQQGSNPRMTEQQKKKRREQWRQQQRQRRQQKAANNVEVCEPPPQKKLGVEMEKVQLKLKLGNHQAPKPRSQLTLMMDHAAVGRQSPPEKKQRMANEIRGQQLGPSRLKHLCSIFIWPPTLSSFHLLPWLPTTDFSDFFYEDIFAGNLMLDNELVGSGSEDDAAFLGVSEDEEAIPPSGVAQASGHTALPQSIHLEVCERAAARLNIEWPAPQSATDQESPTCDLCHSVMVMCACSAALRHWKITDFYAQGTPLGTVMI